jgi:chorismate-pyruvate lyase
MAQVVSLDESTNRGIRFNRPPQTALDAAFGQMGLSILQRILLTTDGTVTEVVETYAGETMRVVKLSQELITPVGDTPWLEITRDQPVLSRKILLQGKVSGENFLYAESFIVPDRLDEHMQDGLLRCNKPIGYLILEDRLETFREIVEWGREPAGQLAAHFAVEDDSPVIFRTYRIFANKQPIMLITEKFPQSGFRG